MNGIGLSSELLERLAGSLLHFLWQGALLALIGVIVLRLMAPRSAESRYAAAVVTMALMLLTPVFTFLFYAETGSATLGAVQLLRASVAGMAQSGAGAGALRLSVWIVFVWSLGVGFCSTRLIAGWVFSRRVIRAAGEAVPPLVIQLMERVRGELQERRAIRLLAGKDVASPVVFGWIRPVVLLPVSAVTGLSEDQLLAVLAHEVAHIRRHDFLVNSLQRAVECVLFYHPAVWWISGRIRVERERCCDDLAVRVCGDRLAYAKALVALENARGSEPALAIPAAGRGVADRVRRLLGVQSPTRDWQSAAIALLFVAMLLVAGAWQPVLAGQAVGRAENPGQAGPDISAQPAARLSPAPTVVQAAEPERQQPVDGIARVGQDAGATLSAALAIATAQDVSPKATSANPEPVVISGRVRDSSGAPAAARTWVRARPEVRQARNIDSYIDETDSEGRYQLDVPPGRYTLTIQDFFGVYPGGTIQAPQKVVTVVAGQRIADVDLEFTFVPSGPGVNPQELRGQVVIDDGGSLPVGTLGRFQVILFSDNAHWITQPFTNMQGIFSFRLVPGEYVVALAPRWLNSYYLKSMTYGDVDLTKSPLTLKPSASDTQVRIVLTRTRPASTTPGVKVSGRITDWKAGGPALALSAILTTMPDRFEVAEVKPRDDGSFEIEGVPPGQYVIGRALSPANRMPVDIRSYLYPSQVIEVGANDVRNLELIFDAQGFPIALSPNVKQAIKGVVEAGDGTIPEFKVEFTEMRVKGGASPPPVTVAGREFSVLLPEGEYRASVSGLPQGYTLKSIASGPFDLTEPFLVTKKGIADRFTGAPIKSGAPGIVIRLNTPSQ